MTKLCAVCLEQIAEVGCRCIDCAQGVTVSEHTKRRNREPRHGDDLTDDLAALLAELA